MLEKVIELTNLYIESMPKKERKKYGHLFYKYGNCEIYGKFSEVLVWETEVWIAEMPDHMIHLNGDRFLGPR